MAEITERERDNASTERERERDGRTSSTCREPGAGR